MNNNTKGFTLLEVGIQAAGATKKLRKGISGGKSDNDDPHEPGVEDAQSE